MVLERRTELVALTEAAVAVALSVLLGTVRLLELPNGGSIALATLPLLAFATARGVRAGVAAGGCAGLAHALSGGTIVHPVQLGLDYFLAYAALGVAGLACGRGTERGALAPWLCLASALHLTANVISGMVFFAPAAGGSAFAFSLAYNAATVVPELALALWLVPPLLHALARANPADSWRRGLLDPPRQHRRSPRPIDVPAAIDTNPASADVSSAARTPRPASLVRGRPFERPALRLGSR